VLVAYLTPGRQAGKPATTIIRSLLHRSKKGALQCAPIISFLPLSIARRFWLLGVSTAMERGAGE
jgi:hypothetical protein